MLKNKMILKKIIGILKGFFWVVFPLNFLRVFPLDFFEENLHSNFLKSNKKLNFEKN
jgi:hypothetical protein